jgi:large subunit ribosomal protein L32e
MLNIGDGTNKKEKHMLPHGFQQFLVYNLKELEVLLMCNESYCSEIVHRVSYKNHKVMVKRIAQPVIAITHSKEMNRWFMCVVCFEIKP